MSPEHRALTRRIANITTQIDDRMFRTSLEGLQKMVEMLLPVLDIDTTDEEEEKRAVATV